MECRTKCDLVSKLTQSQIVSKAGGEETTGYLGKQYQTVNRPFDFPYNLANLDPIHILKRAKR